MHTADSDWNESLGGDKMGLGWAGVAVDVDVGGATRDVLHRTEVNSMRGY